jgi:hypothetical protein
MLNTEVLMCERRVTRWGKGRLVPALPTEPVNKHRAPLEHHHVDKTNPTAVKNTAISFYQILDTPTCLTTRA